MTKKLYYFLSAAATVYTLWYMHFEKPWTNAGALSTVGLKHRALFAVWGTLTFLALSLGVTLVFRTLYNTKVYIPLLALSAVGMALTLACRFDYRYHTEYLLHCGGSLAFSAAMGTTVFLAFLLGFRRHLLMKLFTFNTAAVLLSDIVLLCCLKETALIETLPVFTAYIMLGITVRRSDLFETARKAATA